MQQLPRRRDSSASPRSPASGRSAWNEEEARQAFRVIARLIVPGNPEQSRFLLKPLHPDGGGSYTHNGPRRWQSRDDPGVADAGRVGSRRAQGQQLLVRIRIRQPWGEGAAVSAESKPIGRRRTCERLLPRNQREPVRGRLVHRRPPVSQRKVLPLRPLLPEIVIERAPRLS